MGGEGLGTCPEVELLDHAILLLIFCRNAILFLIGTALFYMPTRCAQEFQFLCIVVSSYDFLGERYIYTYIYIYAHNTYVCVYIYILMGVR